MGTPARDETRSLGQRLQPLLTGGFFRPLSRSSAAVYIDCADRLVASADEGGQVPFQEARLLIREVLMSHPDVELEEDEGGRFRDLNQRAGQFFNKLLEAHWFEPRRVNLDEHYVLVAPATRRLLRMLHDLAETNPADLKDFAATLRGLCQALLSEKALDPARLDPQAMRETVKDLLSRAAHAEEQIHAVETLILQHETAQRSSTSAQETLQRFLVEFHAGEHMVCYDALQKAGLLPRLAQARSVVQEALYDPFTKQRLAEGLAQHLGIESSAAYSLAEKWFSRLERQIASIPVKQRLIDGRMADFSKFSAARYRYQTELRGRRPQQVKKWMETVGTRYQGSSFSELSSQQGMDLLAPSIEFYFGADSLARPRKPRASVDLTFAPAEEKEGREASEEIRRRNLHILTPQRAARFIEKHLRTSGELISSADLHLKVEDDFLDLLAVLSFDRGPGKQGAHRPIKWKVHPLRGDFCVEPEQVPRDRELNHWMERFSVERLS